MKAKDSQVFNINDYLVKNLFDIDEFILKLSSYIPKGQGFDAEMIKLNIERIYFTFEIEKTKGAGIKYKDGTEKIVSEKFYNENKDFFNAGYKDVKLATSLNYNDFFSLNPLIEIIDHYPVLFETKPFEFVDIIKNKVLETEGDTSKSMLILKIIAELDKSYILLENLLHDSLIPLNTIQKTVAQKHLDYDKELFRLLLIKYLPLFQKPFEGLNYASEVFEDIAKNHICNPFENNSFENDADSELFKGSEETYNNFLEYLKKHIVEPYIDFSYLFQRLTHEKMIYKTSHNDFIYWLFNKQYISDKNKEKFLDKRGFYSLGKCSGNGRENNFNNIFGL